MTENENVNHHNDPTGLAASARAASGGKPYLGDHHVVDRLLRELAAGILARYDEVGHGQTTPEKAAMADQAECLRLAGIFVGEDTAYAPIDGWNGPGIAAFLRGKMTAALDGDEDDVGVVAQAFGVFVHHVYDWLRESAGKPEAEIREGLEENVRSFAWALMGLDTDD